MTEQPLRILQVSTADIRGGAEKVAWNLFTSYRARGYGSWLAVGEKRSDDSDVLTIPNQEAHGGWYHSCRGIASRLERVEGTVGVGASLSRLARGLAEPVTRLNYHCGIEDFHFPGTARLLTLAGNRPDILHMHNLHGGYFDLRMLPRLTRQVPVVMTLHDAWLLSGHCAHSFDCERWKTGCGHCPDLTIYPAIRRDATKINWRRKRRLYARSRLHVASPSHWLLQKVEQSMLAPAVVEARVLPNGVDLNTFHPADRQAARAELRIPQQVKVLLATGVGLRENRWKDFQTLREAAARMPEGLKGQTVLLIALGEEAPPQQIGATEIRFVRFQSQPEVVAGYYQAADIYVHAARAETFPTGVLEALACGTPVVATAVGGIPEQIEEGRTGFLVPAGDAAGLAARATQILQDRGLQRSLETLAAETARRRFSLDHQVDAYLDWYYELVRQTRSRGWQWRQPEARL